MGKVITLLSILLNLSFLRAEPTLQAEIDKNNSQIEKLEQKLEKLVERQNQLIAKQAGVPLAPTVDTKKVKNDHAIKSLSEQLEKLEQRIKTLELNQNKIVEKNNVARNADEARATKIAQENAPLLPEANSKAMAQYDHAMQLLQSKDPIKAKIAAESFIYIIGSFPSDPIAKKARVHLGDALNMQQSHEKAKEAYMQALEHKLDDWLIVEAHLGYMEACKALSQKKEAKKYMSTLKALKLKYNSAQQDRLKSLESYISE